MAGFRGVCEATHSGAQATAAGVVLVPPLPPTNLRGARVLLIAADPDEANTIRWALRALDLEISWVRHGLEGLACARRARFDLVIVDATLGAESRFEFARRLRDEDEMIPIVLVGESSSMAVAAGASLLGARALLERPFNSSDVIVTINSALRTPAVTAGAAGPRLPVTTPGSTAERWAYFVLRTIDARVDPNSVRRWAKLLGVSRSALCECCRLVHVSARDARDFSRLVRAICHSGQEWQPETVFDLADGRTLKKLLTHAGFPTRIAHTPSVPEFLERQRWIPPGNSGLVALQALLFGTPAAEMIEAS